MNNPFLSIPNPTPLGAGSYEMALLLINALELKPGMRVLEIGAGTGQVAAIVAKHWGVTVVTFKSYNKWLRTLDWNRNLLRSQGYLITESYYFCEGYQWMLDNFRYYDGEKAFILHDEGRWLGLGLAVGKKVRLNKDTAADDGQSAQNY